MASSRLQLRDRKWEAIGVWEQILFQAMLQCDLDSIHEADEKFGLIDSIREA